MLGQLLDGYDCIGPRQKTWASTLSNDMRININLAPLTNEQLKFLSQLGMFCDDQTWESHCEPEDLRETLDLLKRSGICDLHLHLAD